MFTRKLTKVSCKPLFTSLINVVRSVRPPGSKTMPGPTETAIKHTLRYPPSARFATEEYRVGDHIKTDNIHINFP